MDLSANRRGSFQKVFSDARPVKEFRRDNFLGKAG